ncbi:MAG: hypothetical protein L0177_10770 [Chloroflexi bacterium]|nr:hypothetical protein [Chloroflexota bacterium]
MNSSVTREFRRRLRLLPAEVQEQAARAYALWRANPQHPGLQFKRVSQRQPIYSVRIGMGYRALGFWEADHIYWFWIGPHAEYDNLLKNL